MESVPMDLCHEAASGLPQGDHAADSGAAEEPAARRKRWGGSGDFVTRAPVGGIHHFVLSRDVLGGRQPKAHFPRSIGGSLPHLLKERELKNLQRFDKIFASAWLDTERVICGTKDNQLVVWNVDTGRNYTLPSYLREGFQIDHCGIHSIAISNEGLIATGGQEPSDMLIIDSGDLRPIGLLKGHTDWVFGIEWLDRSRLVSGSRDKSIMVWDVSNIVKGRAKPVAVLRSHTEKVRDVCSCGPSNRFASLSADGSMKTWASDTAQEVSSTRLTHTSELVCMAPYAGRGLFAAGSESHTQIVDPRVEAVAKSIRSLEDGCGVRSLSFCGDVLTVGAGNGSLSFYDMVADRYLNLDQAKGAKSLRTGKGWIKTDDVYHAHFWNQDVPNTVYTHCYDPTHTRLFVGGGPLPFGLCGSYAAVW